MDYLTLTLLYFSFSLAVAHAIFLISGRRHARLPPGPYPLPIIGNLLHVSEKRPHHSLATLAKRYGPLMSLKLGSRTTIVVSSPDVAKEFFQTHDHSFSSRSIPEASKVVDHDKYSMVWLPVGDQWRRLRRISKEYLFSMQCLDATEHLRREIAFTTSLNVLSNLMFSMDMAQYDSESSKEFNDAVRGVLEVVGRPNIADFFPILKPFDPQGLFRRGSIHGKKILTTLNKIINQRLQTRSTSSITPNNDVLDSLLNIGLNDESKFNRNDMRHLFFTLFVAGGDTTSITLEWAMAELIHNPDKFQTTRSEIMKLMQNNKRNIQEEDISQLPYLQAVIKETLRLHPPGAFLVPHQAIHDVEIQGFMVPKNAQILCNVWAMGRDPKIWSNPEKFMPERFLKVDIDYKGQDFELVPFGAGRRMCPGLNMAHRLLHIMLGSLIKNFDWKLEGNMRPQDMDIRENFGLTLPKNTPLRIIPLML
ncbi:hypothetical protein E3N88_37064 [Mikania micrantha]|uniref:Cytochrome P450 n=1 Tax=Mikania micrantha TaxID=192012 RepID=A0A5N6M5K9_9ASTR|nr:hypothetical protein E3N88_37064 [Mikania micrantha]